MKDVKDEDQKLKFLIDLLESPIATRTLTNIQKLVELTINYPFIQNDLLTTENGERIHQLFCQYINYQYSEKDQNLFTLGEKVKYFYLILKGSVGMYTQKRDPITGEKDPYSFEKVKQINEGNSFGELSLLSGKPSIVLAKCESNCHFALLNKNRYKNLLALAGIKFLIKEVGFLSSLPYSESFCEKLVKSIYFKQEIQTFHSGQTVYLEGNPVEDVYIVKSGEFNVRHYLVQFIFLKFKV